MFNPRLTRLRLNYLNQDKSPKVYILIRELIHMRGRRGLRKDILAALTKYVNNNNE